MTAIAELPLAELKKSRLNVRNTKPDKAAQDELADL